MPVYQIWRNPAGTEVSMFQADDYNRSVEQDRLLTTDVDDVPMELIATYWEDGEWEEAWALAIRDESAILFGDEE